MGEHRQTFPRSHRLSGREDFAAVYDARVRQTRGAITMYAKPNALDHSRIGISISRRVGSAPKRNRIKRLLRESYRLQRDELPIGFDWIIVARGHETMTLREYQDVVRELTENLARTWKRKDGADPPLAV